MRRPPALWDAAAVRRRFQLAMLCAVLEGACRSPSSAGETADEPRRGVLPHGSSVQVNSTDVRLTRELEGAHPDAGVDVPDAARPSTPSSASAITLDHAAGMDVQRVLAVGNGQLYHLDGDHWQRLGFAGAEARDVVFSRGALWVLARGTGPNSGHALILRSVRGDDLSVVATPALGADCDPRALLVLRGSGFIVAGNHPSIVAVTGNDVTSLAGDLGLVRSVRMLRNDTIVAQHDAERVSIVRYGVVTPITLPDYLDTVADANGTSYLVHAHGEFSRGRPGREYSAVTTATPFVPRFALALPGERFIVVAAGGPLAEWRHHDWHLTPGDLPHDPIAVLMADPMLVVGRDGMVTAMEPGGPRAIVAPQRR